MVSRHEIETPAQAALPVLSQSSALFVDGVPHMKEGVVKFQAHADAMLPLHGQVGSPELGDGLLPVLVEGEAEAAPDDGPEVAESVHKDLQIRSEARQLLHTAQVLLLQELVAVSTLIYCITVY